MSGSRSDVGKSWLKEEAAVVNISYFGSAALPSEKLTPNNTYILGSKTKSEYSGVSYP